MTRRKKTRSLADKVNIRTGRRKDYRQWRQENPGEVASSRRFSEKKRKQRKLQAARRLERQQTAPSIAIHKDPSTDGETPNGGQD